jgi:hypothetical protein
VGRRCSTNALSGLVLPNRRIPHIFAAKSATQLNKTHRIMPKGKEMFLGLNQNGLIAFIVLLVVCFPLCWIPWLIDSCKADPGKPIE